MPPKHPTHQWGPLADDPWMPLAVEGDIVKNELLRRAGGYLEEELAANWLGMSAEELREHAGAGDLLAVSFDGRLLVPAFQLRNSMTLLRIREILAEMPTRSPWRRLEWWLTPDVALGEQTPLEAFQRGREAEVREIARSHVADGQMHETRDAEKTFGQALDEMGCKPVDLGRRIILRERHRTNRLTRYRAPGSMAHVRHSLLSMKDDLEARGILHIWVYGSVARGDQREDSDVDLVVEINPAAGMSLTGFARLQLDLTDALQRTANLTEWHLLTGEARKDAVEVF